MFWLSQLLLERQLGRTGQRPDAGRSPGATCPGCPQTSGTEVGRGAVASGNAEGHYLPAEIR